MTWAKLDDRFPSHLKVLRLSDAAFRLFVTSVCFCCEQLTNGHIPVGIPETLPRVPARKKLTDAIAELLAVGLWQRTETGWEIHDFLDWNPPAEKVVASKEAAKERMRRAREEKKRREEQRRADERSREHNANVPENNQRSSHNPVPVPVPVPLRSTNEDEEAPAPSPPQAQSIQDRCRWLLKNSWDAAHSEPNRWPEFVAVVDAFNAATGRAEKLGTFGPSGSTRALVENFAAGHSVDELVWAAKSWTNSEHYRSAMAQPGRKPSLSWLKGDVLVTELAKRNPGKASQVDPEAQARVARAAASRARVEAQTNAEIARRNRELAANPPDPALVKNFMENFGR